jgi:hypothetical protein
MELSKGKQKNYRMVFWNLAGLSLVESLLMRFVVDAPQLADSGYMPFIDVIVGLGFFALIVFWCINFQQACKKIGKKNGWAYGLIVIVPYGWLVAVIVAYYTFRKTELWRGENKSFRLAK